jgi:hypothetical protein
MFFSTLQIFFFDLQVAGKTFYGTTILLTDFNHIIIRLIYLVVCPTTGPKALPKRALHIGQSRAFSFKCEYPLLSLKSSSRFLRLLLCLSLTSIPHLSSFLQ